jgi:hypothetical protein
MKAAGIRSSFVDGTASSRYVLQRRNLGWAPAIPKPLAARFKSIIIAFVSFGSTSATAGGAFVRVRR